MKNAYFIVFLLLILAVHLAGLPVLIMQPDAAVYATLARQMYETGNYTDLYLFGKDWLDKPHFPFWLTAWSFTLFGVNTIAYKLPALLLVAIGAVYTFKLAKALYNPTVAQWSVLILLTAQHIITSNNDVRAEPFLTGLIIGSTYHFFRLKQRFNPVDLLVGALWAGCAMMTKGIFTVIPIATAIIGEIVLKKEWKELIKVKWLVAILLSFLFTFPELYALYQQFDAHPEKTIFGQTGVSGIRFFFWDSQFGRFFNTGPIKGEGDIFFALHTLLWAFLPWSLLLYGSFWIKLKQNIPRIQPAQEFYTLAGALPMLVLFSLSKFQLPHYCNVVFPFLAILTAQAIDSFASPKAFSRMRFAQYFTLSLLFLVAFVLHYFYQPQTSLGWFGIALLGVILLRMSLLKSHIDFKTNIIYQSCLGIALVNFYLNLVFYPDLLHYQSSSEAALYANQKYPTQPTAIFGDLRTNSFEFYLSQKMNWYFEWEELKTALQKNTLLIYTNEEHLKILDKQKASYQIIQKFPHFHITTLKPEFINHQTRPQTLSVYYLILANRSLR